MSDSATGSEGQAPDSAAVSEGPDWQRRYDGLQRLVSQRTNDLAEARQMFEEAQRRAEHAEREAAEYRELVSVLRDEPSPATAGPGEPVREEVEEPAEPTFDMNSPRKRPPQPEPVTTESLEQKLRSMPVPSADYPW